MGRKKLLQFGEISFHVHGKAKPVIRPLDDHQTLMLRAAGAVVLLTHVTRNVTVRVTMEKDNGQAALANCTVIPRRGELCSPAKTSR